jgi:hypothetical protein
MATSEVTMDDLYAEMKEAMAYLGVKWGFKHTIKVRIVDNQLVFTHYSKAVAIDINRLKEQQ